MTVYHGDAGDIDDLLKRLREDALERQHGLDGRSDGPAIEEQAADCIEAQQANCSYYANLAKYRGGRLALAERVLDAARAAIEKMDRGALGPWHEEWLDDTRAAIAAYDEAPK